MTNQNLQADERGPPQRSSIELFAATRLGNALSLRPQRVRTDLRLNCGRMRAMAIAELESELSVPDRFEQLRHVGTGSLRSLVRPVVAALEELDDRFADLRAAHRGGLMVLRGEPGSGKSTFLDTVGLFREGVVTERVPLGMDVGEALTAVEESDAPRLIVIEGREALSDFSEQALESSLHAINTFVRSPAGRNTLVVWPSNRENLTAALVDLGAALGGDALMGVGEPVLMFTGPSQSEYVEIAERTISALNEGATLAALGISEEDAAALTENCLTIGRFLALVRQRLVRNGARVRRLLESEQARMWTLVIAGSDAEGDVAALTRGGLAAADIDRLLTATGANIVNELRKEPDTLGILGTVLNARILNMDMVTVLAIVREFADDDLRALMRTAGLSIRPDPSALERLRTSEIGIVMAGGSLGTRRRGGKPGSSTKTAFEALSAIAREKDGLLNAAIGRAFVAAGLADSFETEKVIGSKQKYLSDIYLMLDGQPLRLELMWRTTTSRAEIANYVLGKLWKYAKAIGLMK